MKKSKIVSLISGGLDSCTTTGKLAIKGNEIYPIFIDYGQKAFKKELDAAKKYLNFLRKKYDVHKLVVSKISLPFLKIPMTGYGKIPKTNKKNTTENEKINFVPSRNIIFISIASSYANLIKAKKISIGYCENEPSYPDCDIEFFNLMEKSLSKGTYDKIKILTPFSGKYKKDIVKYSKKHNLPVHFTWSCFEDKKYHCGLCKNCKERKNAFEITGLKDPTEYIN